MKENDSSKSKSEKQHGVFKVTNPIPQFTKAKFLSEMGKETSVFVRFSTVQGSRGSTDMPRLLMVERW
jgi:catalase